MHGNAKLERFANTDCLDATSNAAPERCVEKYHIHGGVERVRRQLFKVHDHGICSERNPDHFPRAPHSVQTKHGIFKIVVLQVLDGLAESYSLFCGPHSVWIKSKRVLRKCCGKGTIRFKFIVGRKNSAFDLVRRESVLLSQFPCMPDHLIDGAHFACSVFGIWITKEAIRRELHPVSNAAAKDVGNRNAPGLPENIETRKLQRREDLSSVVVELSL